MDGTTFRDALGHSKSLVGTGQPALSLTPYNALCMSVPLINSDKRWNKKDPEDETRWVAKYEGLLNVGSPYVHHVKQGDAVELRAALKGAAANPIERIVPSPMTKRPMQG
ncbi:hypothetical protein NliqN6_4585 [Naganishia liquefaciens]|uniref:Uncharacterized protein n=1 Tax=Naganishia liquefaciens TaxID=104408 RepID=A0A8H3TW48_9TREE|nr:hypothetical protein NliqN6_4585 [Naganishia liquefaciens]